MTSSLFVPVGTAAPKHGPGGPAGSSPAGAGNRGHIPEVHGLRGLALVLVVLFHLFGAGRVSGGVDVFLVVSGFVVTRSLVRRAAEGRLRIGENLARTAGRLVPSALVVLAAVAAAAWWLMPSGRWMEVSREIVASALFFENWELISSQLSYGAAGPAASPLQHFWSLSVQGQFLLAWPFVVAALVWLARGSVRRGGTGAGPLAVVLVLGTAASLAYALWLTGVDQAVAYFHTGTRFWEIGLGALVALALPHISLPHALRACLGWLGLALVASSGFLFDGGALFPGVEALWPVGGALLVLLGAGTRSSWGPRGFLELRPLRFLADVSYELYLWHWPILVFVLLVTGAEQITWLQAAGILAVSVLLAWLTTLALSKPLRRRISRSRTPLAFAGLGIAVAAVATPVAVFTVVQEREQATQLAALEEMTDGDAALESTPPVQHPGPAALEPGFSAPVRWAEELVPRTDVALQDSPGSVAGSCVQEQGNGDGYEVVTECPVVEPENPARTVVIFGASHAFQWEPALERIADHRDWRLVTIGKAGCRAEVFSPGQQGDCARWSRDAMKRVVAMRPDAVVVSGTRTAQEAPAEKVRRKQVMAWRHLQSKGIDVVAIRDNPRFAVSPADCVDQHGPTAAECSLPRDVALASENPLGALRGRVPAARVDMSDWLCTDTTCPAVVGNVLVYRDAGHMTATYARQLAPMLDDKLQHAAPWLYGRGAARDAGSL